MPTVVLSSSLRRHAGGAERVELEALRVDEMIEALCARYPGLRGQLEQMSIAIDGEIHSEALYEDLRPDSEVHFVPRVSGGA